MGNSMHLTFIVFCTLFLAGCSFLGDLDSKPPIVLGAIYNLTGSQSALDIPSSRGAELAISEINQAGGVLERRIELVLEDGQSRPAHISLLTAQMLDAHPSMSAMFGLSDSDMVMAAAPMAAENQRLFLTSGATSPTLPALIQTYLYLACFGDNVQAAAAAEWAFNSLAVRRVGMMWNDTMSYTQGLSGYFGTRFQELGGQIISAAPYEPGSYDDAISKLNRDSDMIFLAAGPADAPEAVEALRKAGFTQPILGGDGLDEPQVWAEKPKITNLYYTSHVYLGADNTDPEVVAFRNSYLANYGVEPTAFAALGYDTARLIFRAIEDADSTEPNKVREALAEVQDFQGVTGLIRYPVNTRIPKKSVSIIAVDGGVISLAQELVPERVPSP